MGGCGRAVGVGAMGVRCNGPEGGRGIGGSVEAQEVEYLVAARRHSEEEGYEVQRGYVGWGRLMAGEEAVRCGEGRGRFSVV